MALPGLSPEFINSALEALPDPVAPKRRESLAAVMQEWSEIDLPLILASRSPAGRSKKLARVSNSAQKLREALCELGAQDRAMLAHLMAAPAEDTPACHLDERTPTQPVANQDDESVQTEASYQERHRAFNSRLDRIRDEPAFLAQLSAASSDKIWKRKPGQPHNRVAHLVLQDAAAIFEWYSGMRASRNVDSINNVESGPFYRFVAILWPVIFGNGLLGLTSAMRNWPDARSLYGEQSAVISNMARRHRSWGLFDK